MGDFSKPFSREVELIDRIADAITGTDEVKHPSGNRVNDSLQRIAEYVEDKGSGAKVPSVTEEDDGKFLRVVDGAWQAESILAWQGGGY